MARPKRSRRTLATLVVLVLLSVTIITLDETGRASFLFSGVKTAASDVYSPLRSGVNGVLDPIGRFFAGAVDYGSLQKENQKLQAEIATLEQRGTANASFRREYAALEKLLAIDKLPSLAALTTVPAEVTAQSVSDFAATITIDKGRDEAVTVGDPVVGPGGLIGQVVIATHTGATVRLLTDGASDIGVTFGHQEEATLKGRGAGRLLTLQYVASATPISRGETVYTSGLQGAVFPAGIPVATVTSVRNVPGAADKVVRAKPIADLSGLSYVEVLVWSGSS